MVMSFGLINASTTCQEMINDALRQYLDIFVIAYLDDIMIYSTTLEKHVQHVSQVLECLDNGIRINPEKIRAVKEWPTPIDVKDI